MHVHVFEEAEKRGHEHVSYFYFPEVGLKAIVAIHSTVLGPSLGGCRMRLYDNESEALDDVLRLSEAMTYKNSIAGLDLGGGKACIIADPKFVNGRKELFLKFGHCLNSLAGDYITAEDMGTNVSDIMIVREVSKHVAGISKNVGGSGDPSPWTADGVFYGIIAATERVFSSKDLSGKKIALQGVGNVGMHLLRKLSEAGAKVVVCDTSHEALKIAKERYGVEVVSVDDIYDVECDIFSPNAIGKTVSVETLKRLKCKIIAGAANNQLSSEAVYDMIVSKNILYCPDFVINAGGVINVGAEYVKGGWQESWVKEKVDAIYETTCKVLDRSISSGVFPEIVALSLAKDRIDRAKLARNG